MEPAVLRPQVARIHRPAGAPLGGSQRLRLTLRALLLLLCPLALGLLLARAPLALCTVLVLGTIGGLLLFLRPAFGLYALAFAVPFGSLRELHLGALTIGASELLLLAIVVAWLAHMMAFRQVRLARTRLVWALLLYLGTLAVSLWPARDLLPALKEPAKWVEFTLLYLFVASETKPAERRTLIAALLLAGTVQGALGIVQFVRQVGPPEFILLGKYMRAHGTFAQPNPYGGYLGLLLPLAYATVLTSWPRRSVRTKGQPWPILFWGTAALAGVVMLAALIMSWSRGALLGLLAGAGLVALALGRRFWLVMATVVLLLFLLGPDSLLTKPTVALERVTEMAQYLGQDLTAIEITDENFAVIERLAHWLAAWRMFERRPWLGVGAGQYATAYPSVALPRWREPLGHAHNFYLNVLAEGGLVGLASYLIFMLAALVAVWRAARRERGWQRGLALGALGMLGHLLVHSIFDNLYVHEMYLLVAMLLGMTSAVPPKQPILRR